MSDKKKRPAQDGSPIEERLDAFAAELEMFQRQWAYHGDVLILQRLRLENHEKRLDRLERRPKPS